MTLLTITGSSSSISLLRNSMGGGPQVMKWGHRAEKIESEIGTVWQSLKEFSRWLTS